MKRVFLAALAAALLIAGDAHGPPAPKEIPIPPTHSLCPVECGKNYFQEPERDYAPQPMRTPVRTCTMCNIPYTLQT